MTYLSNLKDNLIPGLDDGYSIGSSTMRWKDGYFGNHSLHVVTTAGETGTATDWNLSVLQDGYLSFNNVDSGYVAITRFGNVGIGTTHPAAKLDIDILTASQAILSAKDDGYTVLKLDDGGIATLSPSVLSSGANTSLTFFAPSHTGQAASTEVTDINLDLNRELTHATGALATQRAIRVQPRTYSFAGSSTVTDAVLVDIGSTPLSGTNATLTSTHALRVSGGTAPHVGVVTTGYALRVIQGTNVLTAGSNNTGNVAARIDGKLNIQPNSLANGLFNQVNRQLMLQTANFTSIGGTTAVAPSDLNYVFIDFGAVTQLNFNATSATQQAFNYVPPVYTSVAGNQIITDAVGFNIARTPRGATGANSVSITNAYAQRISTVASINTTNAFGLQVNAPTGATVLNVAADFTGGMTRVSNGSTVQDIFQARDNTTAVFTIGNDGYVDATALVSTNKHWFNIGAGGTLGTSGTSALHLDTKLNAGSANQYGVDFNVTSGASTLDGYEHVALRSFLGTGSYTKAGFTTGLYGRTQALNSGVKPITGIFPSEANYGVFGMANTSAGSTTGTNVGVGGDARDSTTLNVGVLGKSNSSSSNIPNVGVMGIGSNLFDGYAIGVLAGLRFSDPGQSGGIDLRLNAALLADNNVETGAPIFIARSNSSTVFAIDGYGYTTLSPAPNSAGSGNPNRTTFKILTSSSTGQNGGTEVIDVDFDLSHTTTHDTSALTTQRAMVVRAPTYAFGGASTITNAATLAITGAPIVGTNATITNNYALWVQGGMSRFDDALEVPEIATPATPGSGRGRIYAKSDNKLYFLNDAGSEVDLTAGAGSGTVSSATTNQVAYYTGSTTIGGDADLTFDGTTFVAQALTANASSLDRVVITGGTLTSGKSALTISATLPTGTPNQFGISNTFTAATAVDTAGSQRIGYFQNMTGSWTGGSSSAFFGATSITGTATETWGVNNVGNAGVRGQATSAASGHNSGMYGVASNSSSQNAGLFGAAVSSAAGNNIGVAGIASNGSGFNVGGVFQLGTDTPTLVTSALLVTNGTQTSPIFIARDNNTTVFTIADGGAVTATQLINADGGIDRSTAATLSLGATTANLVEIGRTGFTTRVKGDLVVDGYTTNIHSEQVFIDDNTLYLNSNYNTVSAQTGGLIVNYLPTSTTTTVNGSYIAGVAFTSNPTVTTTGSATFTAGDFIQISGSVSNNGLFEVANHSGTTLTIRGVGTISVAEDFTQNQFTTGSSDSAVIRKVNVSIIRAGIDGLWETALGSSAGLSFTDLSTSASSGWTDDGTVVRLTTVTDQVSIGSASPLANSSLYVESADSGDNTTVEFKNTSSAGRSSLLAKNDAGTDLQFTVLGSAQSGTSFGLAKANLARISGGTTVVLGTIGSNPLVFGTNSAEVARFDPTGLFAVGATSVPSGQQLYVKSADAADSNTVTLKNTQAASRSSLSLENDEGTGLTIASFGSTNAGTLFGLTRARLTNIRSTSGGMFLIGTQDAQSFVLGTNSTERIRILSTGEVGIGTNSPVNKVDIHAGTLSTGQSALSVIGTLAATGSTEVGELHTITTAAGAGLKIGSWYTIDGVGNSTTTIAMFANNIVTGTTGTGTWGAANVGNIGFDGSAQGASSAHNTGVFGDARGSTTQNAGVWGEAAFSSAGNNFGMVGQAANGAVNIGGFFRATSTLSTPTFSTSAALMADNSDAACDIFVGRAAGSPVFTIASTGAVGMKSTTGYVGLRFEGTGTYAGSDWNIYASSTTPSSANDFLGFYNNSSSDGATAEYKLTIHKSGQIGIGVSDTVPGARLVVNSSAAETLFEVRDSGTAKLSIADGGALTQDGGAVFNEAGGDFDLRVEGTTDANLVFVDASTDSVGIGTSAPNSKLEVKGSFALPITTKTTDYTATAADYTILCNANSGVLTIVLPTAAGIAGRVYVIKKIDSSSNNVVVDGNSSETIDGTLTQTLSAIYESVTIQSNGTAWFVL